MTPEIILTLIGMGGAFTVFILTVIFGLVRWLVASATTKWEGTFNDHETRMRKVEGAAAESVRRSDLDKLREELRADLDRQSQQLIERLTETRGAPVPRRRRA